MAKPNFIRTRAEAIAAIVEDLYALELTTSADEYDAKTRQIMEDLGRISCPSEKEFKARSEKRRAPWIRVMDRALSAIKDGSFKYPHWVEQVDGDEYLLVRPAHIMQHADLAWKETPPLSGRMLKRGLLSAGILLVDEGEMPRVFERTIAAKDGRHSWRCGHLNALLLWKAKMTCEGGSQ